MPSGSTGAVPRWVSGTVRPGLPAGFRLALDGATRRLDGGRVLVGGAPLRILRLGPAGVTLVDCWLAGGTVADDPGASGLARRLTDAGFAHPVPLPHRSSAPPATVAVVVPVRDDAAGLRRLLPGLLEGPSAVVVIDDGSADPAGVAEVVAEMAAAAATAGVTLSTRRHDRPRGPGAARTTGAAATDTDLVAFVDADVTVPAGWLGPLVAHFADPCVAAAAPRVAAGGPIRSGRAAADLLLRYERHRSPLDLGDRPATVRPGSPVPYVPSAVLVVRRAAMASVGGFDTDLQVGEDVDLVWRLVGAGGVVRYEPAVTVHHAVRADARGWLSQRYRYGTSAAVLARRHPDDLSPVRLSGYSLAAWALTAAGWPGAGTWLAGATTAALATRLPGVAHPVPLAARLGSRGHLAAGGALAAACRREWWPLALTAARWRRLRPALALAAAGPPLWRWARSRPSLGPASWLALHLADDAAYGAGVWAGCLRHRTAAPLRPRLVSWPGRRATAVTRGSIAAILQL